MHRQRQDATGSLLRHGKVREVVSLESWLTVAGDRVMHRGGDVLGGKPSAEMLATRGSDDGEMMAA
jgi:hypothetical protein